MKWNETEQERQAHWRVVTGELSRLLLIQVWSQLVIWLQTVVQNVYKFWLVVPQLLTTTDRSVGPETVNYIHSQEEICWMSIQLKRRGKGSPVVIRGRLVTSLCWAQGQHRKTWAGVRLWRKQEAWWEPSGLTSQGDLSIWDWQTDIKNKGTDVPRHKLQLLTVISFAVRLMAVDKAKIGLFPCCSQLPAYFY